jgi:hypothetical protein
MHIRSSPTAGHLSLFQPKTAGATTPWAFNVCGADIEGGNFTPKKKLVQAVLST